MSFSTLGLSSELLRAIADQGYTDPTPIQSQAIPAVLTGRDLMAAAQTGTGKTAGFTLPLLQRLSVHASNSTSPAKHPVRGLILTPTRELAAQVEESVQAYGKYLPLRVTVVYGGVNMDPQIKALLGGVDILVATPGRLLDHVQQRTVNLSRVEFLVLDEADRMLDMGFMPDIKRILSLLPPKRQNLLFSATFSDDIKKLAQQLLNDPVLIEVARSNSASEMVTQVAFPVSQEHKRDLLTHLIKSRDLQQVLVFTRTKQGANRLAGQLQRDGLAAAAIHGDKSQIQRTQALTDFKSGAVKVLVATDVAARGLDIDQLPYVINFELPSVPEDYVHRIGRTGRAGSTGDAISLVSPDELKQLADIERLLKREIPKETIAGFDTSGNGAPAANRREPRGRSTQPEPRNRPPRTEAHSPSRRSEPVSAKSEPPSRVVRSVQTARKPGPAPYLRPRPAKPQAALLMWPPSLVQDESKAE